MFNNKKLGIVFIVLAVLVLIMFWTDGGKNERTFRENLVDFDSTSVTEITIISKSNKEVILFKDDIWKVKLPNGKSVSVTQSKIDVMLKQLLELKPNRLAARSESKWADFQTDTTGTRVIVKDGSSTALDLIIGRFAFKQPRTMNTFVRLSSDKDVYEVSGFLQPTFNQDVNSYRNGKLITNNVDVNTWKNVEFEYPADSSFQLVKLNDKWRTVKNQVDSAKAIEYLRKVSSLAGSSFDDDIDPSTLSNPLYKITIQQTGNHDIIINEYKIDDKILVVSSGNSEAIFNGNENDFWEKIFVGEKSFIK